MKREIEREHPDCEEELRKGGERRGRGTSTEDDERGKAEEQEEKRSLSSKTKTTGVATREERKPNTFIHL